MKSYGMKGDMNPQTKQKAQMAPKSKGDSKKGSKAGCHDMSPKVKEANEQAVWQNMRG